jgi:molybdopterin molybdotransferase
MISFEEAQKIVFSSVKLLDQEAVDLQNALGRILAEPILADSDIPSFSRSAMDGYACRAEDQDQPLDIIEEIPAGKFPGKMIGPGQCARIMTGAPVPAGCDLVIRVEDTRLNASGQMEIMVKGTSSNIRLQGEDVKKNGKIILPGQQINKQHVGIMAMVGCTHPVVYRQPSVGVISTGAELVGHDQKPDQSQIRNSNGPQLMAQVSNLGLLASNYGIVTDVPELIREKILNTTNRHDVVLISGGVSAGDYDFVPGILQEIGMNIKMHKMKTRPGKPLLFAVNDHHYVFGVPGNPVSTFVQFECLIKPFLLKLMGSKSFDVRMPMLMGEDYQHLESSLHFFIPVRIDSEGIFTLPYHGSGHLTAYAEAEGILEIPPGKSYIRKGEKVLVRPI